MGVLNSYTVFLQIGNKIVSNFELNLKVKCYKGKLIQWVSGRALVGYSILLDDQKECEAENFYIKFEDQPRFAEDIELITQVIKGFMRHGAREGRFRPEGPVHAIPSDSCSLRMYCVRMNNNCVVFGNGGEKTSQRTQDSPDCDPHWNFMVAFEKEFRRKIVEQELGWGPNNNLVELVNNAFYFEFGNCD